MYSKNVKHKSWKLAINLENSTMPPYIATSVAPKKPSPESNIGQIVVRVPYSFIDKGFETDDVSLDKNIPTIYLSPEDERIPVNFSLLFRKKQLQFGRDFSTPWPGNRYNRAMMSRSMERSSLSAEIIKEICDSRKLILLVHSLGGQGGLVRIFKEVAELITNNNGTVDAYIRGEASSNAAAIIALAERRFALDGSSVMLHLAEEEAAFPDDKKKAAWKEIVAPFLQMVKSETQTLQILFDGAEADESNCRNEISLSTLSLRLHGILDGILNNPRELLDKFLAETGITSCPEDQSDPVLSFFY